MLAPSGRGGDRTVCKGWPRLRKSSGGPSWPHPTLRPGPREMMDAQGASRAGRRRYAGEVEAVGEALTFFTAGWKRKSPASFRSSQIMGMRGTASMAASARRPPGRSPSRPSGCLTCCLSRAPRPSAPEVTRHAVMKIARRARWEMQSPPAQPLGLSAAAVAHAQSPPQEGLGGQISSPSPRERVSGSGSLPSCSCEAGASWFSPRGRDGPVGLASASALLSPGGEGVRELTNKTIVLLCAGAGAVIERDGWAAQKR